MTRIGDKITEIERFLDELNSFFPANFEEYARNFKLKAASERYFEKIIEAVIDLAFLIIKEKTLKIPEDDKAAFDILYDNKLISRELSEKLKNAKGMRNIISHQYGSIDDKIVFDSITKELVKDVKDFIDSLNQENR